MYTLEDQLNLEKEYKEYARDLFLAKTEESLEKGRVMQTAVAKGMVNHLKDVMATNVRHYIEEELKPKRGVQKAHKKLLQYLVDHDGIDTTVLNACTFTFEQCISAISASKKNISMSSISNTVGQLCYYESKINNYLKEHAMKNQAKKITEEIQSRLGTRYRWSYINQITRENGFVFYKAEDKELMSYGATLVDIFMQCTGLAEYEANGKVTTIRPTDFYEQAWKVNLDRLAEHSIVAVPTIIPPKDWTNIYSGGYYGALANKAQLIRLPFHITKTRTYKQYMEKLSELDLSNIYEAVNRIQRTAYRINTETLAVLEEIVDKGGDMAGIERLEPYEKLPNLQDPSEEELKAHKKKAVEIIHKEIARKSKAIRVYKTLHQARAFSKYETIYFPVNIDFRGRIYPMSYLSHQGDDLMKSLIMYADPEPCHNTSDFDLLKIQGCNLWGNDKVPLLERIEWTNENTNKILAVAKEPMSFRWWMEADEPMQFLSFCLEYKKAYEFVSKNGNIIGYKCGIVIAYDGTCSGLQHYSAMLKDEVGGSAVNLMDHERPSDIYQNVADKVIEMVATDAKNGTGDEFIEREGDSNYTRYGTKTIAQTWLSYGITRKVCKRPVMTLAYGSGQYGFGEQIKEDTTSQNDIFKGMEGQSAKYMAEKIWKAVQSVIVSATRGMEYLKALAKELIKEDLPVNWYTPLGLPIQQQYLKMETKSFRTRFGARMSMPLYYQVISDEEHVDAHAQKNGIAPNFIHSLDATHLMMTVLASNSRHFSTIHDSFGTSLGEAENLKKVIREQLYKLYTEYKPLEMFKQYVEDQIGHTVEIEAPPKGTLDLSNILKSTYVFH